MEPYRLRVQRVTLRTPKVDRPIRVLHISDIQAPRVGDYEGTAFDVMKRLRPDLVLSTGDILQPRPPAYFEAELPKLARLFETLETPVAMFNVVGDTDSHMRLLLLSAPVGGLRTLDSRSASATVEGARIEILGLRKGESARPDAARERVRSWLEEDPAGGFRIVMGHRPDFVMGVDDLPVDLCLAGHTHGGQIRLPFIGPLWIKSAIPRRLARGFFEVGTTHLNVSAGIGSEHGSGVPPIRLGCPPEMTLIELVPDRLPDVDPAP